MSKGQLWKPQYDTIKVTTAVGEGQAIKLGANDREGAIVTAITDHAIGFASGQAYKLGATADIFRGGGEAYAKAGGAITKGVRLKLDANGDLVVAADTDTLTQGYSLEIAADGDLFRFFFFQGV